MGNQVLLENGLKMETSELNLSGLSIDAVICRQHVVSVRQPLPFRVVARGL